MNHDQISDSESKFWFGYTRGGKYTFSMSKNTAEVFQPDK